MTIDIVPRSLKDAPAMIEHIWPTGKISAEAQKERKANVGQTLTSLGSYWKGRKPLVLVRACVLGSLLPATEDPQKDLDIFEKLMGIDDAAFENRVKRASDWPGITRLPYTERMADVLRPEELGETAYSDIWPEVNAHLGTNANSFGSLTEQLGIMRFGHRPKVADTFCGGGSIPFEAARLGCDVYAADLNPIACMLTWGALNIIGADETTRKKIKQEQQRVVETVDREITELLIEHDGKGNRAKAYLYCLETRCPETGWMVPLAPSWVISKRRNVVGRLVPNQVNKCYDIEIVSDVSDAEMQVAENGTVRDHRLFHPMSSNELGVAIKDIRGDYLDAQRNSRNRLRQWDKSDVMPRPEDIFQERLYCIHWITRKTLGKRRQETFFAAPTEEDLARERKVDGIVRENLSAWQDAGLVPDMRIEPGKETTRLLRERGWTYWHHLYTPRQLLLHAKHKEKLSTNLIFGFANALDWNSKLSHWHNGWDKFENVFYNQALNTFYNFGLRSSLFDRSARFPAYKAVKMPRILADIRCEGADQIRLPADVFITDPPYADAVNYHEITEFFIAWLRSNPPTPFAEWEWDSRRVLAIQGDGQGFRAGMVNAYKAMTEHMPDNGLQIVMFTHQSGKVWSDMAQIFWGAGLQVMADWYIATETTSDLKKGGYVQGTHIIVLRKRKVDLSGYSDEITQEVKTEVADQIQTMVGLNQKLTGHGRMENLFEDADLQMAGYAAVLRVLTKYTKIDGKDMTVEALRPRSKSERTIVEDIVEFAVQVANEYLVPEGLDTKVWERRRGVERFYFRMMDLEAVGLRKLDNYQNFAKAFRVSDYTTLMEDLRPNNAHLKSAADFGKRLMGDEDDFGSSVTRAILFALWEMSNEVDDDLVFSHLRDLVRNYAEQREDLQAIASYIALKRDTSAPDEARHARILAGLIKNERIG